MKIWKHKIDIKQFLDEDGNLEKTKKGLIPYLKSEKISKIISEELTDKLEFSEDIEEFDDALSELYDYADENNIWLGI